MSNMWEAATLDYERERLDGYIAAASVAVAEQHGFVIQASTRQEFDDRLALVATAVERAIDRVTYAEPGSFPTVHQAVLASWERDFDLLTEQRQVEAQRRNARRAFFRRQAEGSKHTAAGRFEWKWPGTRTPDSMVVMPVSNIDANERIAQGKRSIVRFDITTGKGIANWKGSDGKYFHHLNSFMGAEEVVMPKEFIDAALAVEYKSGDAIGGGVFVAQYHGEHEVLRAKCESCGWSGSKKKPKKTSGFRVVDDSSGASTGTVYPNKEIAEQANYGDGYSVQYTDEKVKTASLNWQRQQNGPGENHWHLTPSDFRPGQWVRISPVGEGFMLSIFAADGGDYTADTLLLHERYETLDEAKEAAEYWRKTASVNKLAVTWSDLGLQQVQTYNGLSERLHLWTAEEMGVTGDVITFMGGYMWYVHSIDDQEGDALASGKEPTLEAAQAMAERAMAEHSTQMSLFASKTAANLGGYLVFSLGESKLELNIISWAQADGIKPESGFFPLLGTFPNDHAPRYYGKLTGRTTRKWDLDCPTVELYEVDTIADEAGVIWGVRGKRVPGMWAVRPEAQDQLRSVTAGENPFAKKDDDKKDAPKDDQTDSDQDGEQDGPAQPGEQPEPAGDDATAAPAQAAPADQQAAQADPNATQDPAAAPDAAQDKGQAQDPASTADAAQDQQKPSDPTVMDVGQSTSMGFTMADGGSTGSIEVTFVREENGVYFFNGPTGEFGVGQMNGQWQDADGNTFTFGGSASVDQGIGPAQEQAAAADAATPTPTPAGNAQQPAPAAPADPNAAPAAPATDAAPAADDSAKADPPKDDSGDEKKDDGEKKENPFAKKGD
jgi:hypothetical protein